jgi:hypothetical protein
MGRFRRRREASARAARQAREMSGQAEQVALAQRAAALARVARAWEAALAGGSAQDGPDFEPIAGVGLAQFAAVSRGIAAFGHDQSKLGHVTASAGIPAQRWEIAARGWQDRIQGNHAVARRFNQFYREAWA